ncbi:putative DNA-binding transcriptional regulator YafY [Herbihabitans rhizosphaerae]|uniref:Putative DNA-binding transcriptional regulator YafY n=1 Tax=Herbihabitans rhizosphaerae TaxID=1872711 RepID=A0A4Q7KKQ2_9PSEU|nr:YafY family protein [Herbihabitans rhizosphaerae]RZS36794.1 putative DNA-binding transcriptional regulator YafY [Herbihabitans rhizosphaerae]
MSETTPARLLRLLSLLQMHRDWTGTELAGRLGVTTRTVRRDVDRLRELGYPVNATMGAVGGYRLGAGAAMPPLLLDDDEAVAVAVGLRTAAGGSVTGVEEPSLRALTKLEQVLPSRLRHRVDAMGRAMVSMRPTGAPTVDAETLTTISAAIRATETLRFDYVRHDGGESRRNVEPHKVVSWGRKWYLIGWDTARTDWRTFRVDRISPRTPNGPRFAHREPPDGDVVAYLKRTMGFEMWPYRCRVRLPVPASEIEGTVDGVVTPIGERSCRVEMPTESFDIVIMVLGMLDMDFTAESPPEFVAHVRKMSRRLGAATS